MWDRPFFRSWYAYQAPTTGTSPVVPSQNARSSVTAVPAAVAVVVEHPQAVAEDADLIRRALLAQVQDEVFGISIAVHAASGAVYRTEDRGDGLFFRFLPEKPGELAAGKL